MLILTNVSKKIGLRSVLQSINLTIDPHSIHVFLGSSGVGKSTLLRVLCGLETFDGGTITLNGIPLLSDIEYRKSFGMVFQHFNLFKHLTVLNNISFPLQKILNYSKEKADKIAYELLERYALEKHAQHSVTDLSGGQKQRLAIARTLALSPQIICMDEPTSALDPLLTSYIATTIENLAREGYTIIIATHDTFLVEKLPCTIHLMREGTIIQSATNTDYTHNPSAYQDLDGFIQGR